MTRHAVHKLRRSIRQVMGVGCRVAACAWKFLLGVLSQALGTIPAVVVANTKISKRTRLVAQTKIAASDLRLQLTLDQIKEQFNVDLQRLARIEEKARATVFGVSLSVGLVTPGIALLTGNAVRSDGLKVPFAALLCSAVFFLLVSGFLAILGYKAGRVFRPNLEDHEPLIPLEEEQKTLIHCLDLNTLSVLKKNNLLSASVDCLRNGLGAVLGLLLLMILSAL